MFKLNTTQQTPFKNAELKKLEEGTYLQDGKIWTIYFFS